MPRNVWLVMMGSVVLGCASSGGELATGTEPLQGGSPTSAVQAPVQAPAAVTPVTGVAGSGGQNEPPGAAMPAPAPAAQAPDGIAGGPIVEPAPAAPAPAAPAPAAPAPAAPAPAAPAPAPPGPMTMGQTLPPVTDYAAPGPFRSQTINNTGPDGQYTMFRPMTLGDNGFLHPPLTWGNGITTTPATYPILLSTVASHGIVVIASNSSAVTSQLMKAGLDWLIAQNKEPGSEFFEKLDTSRAVAMGYSLGGGAAVGVGAHPNVITTIAMHPAPGFGALHGPLLLFSGTNDTVCTPDLFVQPIYNGASVPKFYANLMGATHLEPVITGGNELAPSIAWLRMHLYDDQGARAFFYGADCTLCGGKWVTQKMGFD